MEVPAEAAAAAAEAQRGCREGAEWGGRRQTSSRSRPRSLSLVWRLSRRAWLGFGLGFGLGLGLGSGTGFGLGGVGLVRGLGAPRCARAPRWSDRRCTARHSRSAAPRPSGRPPAARPPQTAGRTCAVLRLALVVRGRRVAAPRRGGARSPLARPHGWHTRATRPSIVPVAGWAVRRGHARCRTPPSRKHGAPSWQTGKPRAFH